MRSARIDTAEQGADMVEEQMTDMAGEQEAGTVAEK